MSSLMFKPWDGAQVNVYLHVPRRYFLIRQCRVFVKQCLLLFQDQVETGR